MKKFLVSMVAIIATACSTCFAQNAISQSTPKTPAEQEMINLSRNKWQWMAEKNADKLAELFHDEAQFVHRHVMWNFPLPLFLQNNPALIGTLQMILAAIVMGINHKFFTNGFKGLIHRAPNMDTLVAMGSSASFVYSFYVLILMFVSKNSAHYLHDLYFESAAMILALITLGKMDKN